MIYIALCFGTFVVGVVTALFISWRVWKRMALRLTARGGLVATAVLLEARRDAHDYGRDAAVRVNAGEPANIRGISITRPGALYLSNATRLDDETT